MGEKLLRNKVVSIELVQMPVLRAKVIRPVTRGGGAGLENQMQVVQSDNHSKHLKTYKSRRAD